MTEWQTIDTAPLDVFVLGCNAGEQKSICVVEFAMGVSNIKYPRLSQVGSYAEDDVPDYDITHWMPLPEVKK